MMYNYNNFLTPTFMGSIAPLLLILVILDVTLKGVALWYAARAGQKYWFVALLILNTVGILPLVYIFLFRKNK